MRRELELEAQASSQLLAKAEALVREALQAAAAAGEVRWVWHDIWACCVLRRGVT